MLVSEPRQIDTLNDRDGIRLGLFGAMSIADLEFDRLEALEDAAALGDFVAHASPAVLILDGPAAAPIPDEVAQLVQRAVARDDLALLVSAALAPELDEQLIRNAEIIGTAEEGSATDVLTAVRRAAEGLRLRATLSDDDPPVEPQADESMSGSGMKRQSVERGSSQGQLERTHKLEAMGLLAAGIAHEINTPTQFVTDNVHFIQDAFADILGLFAEMRSWKDDARSTEEKALAALDRIDADYLEAELPRALEQTLDGLKRISRIVGAMKDFSHPGIEGFQPMDVNAALESSATVTHNEWKYLADLEFDLDPELPRIPALVSELHQVFVNLIINAAHAIQERRNRSELRDWRGKILVQTRQVDDRIEIAFHDTGCGIAKEHQGRIFERYFTTKGVGQGTGQGLALCHEVVREKHGGRIDFESVTGRGTVFTLKLPLAQPADGR